MALPATLANAVSVRDRFRRVRDHGLLAVQSGLAAGTAWWVAYGIIGHHEPFFAPIAALAVLSASLGQRVGRVIELAIGVAVGVLVGDLLVNVLGNGPLQLGVIVVLAVLAAVFVRASPVLIVQSAASAVLVVAVRRPGIGIGTERFEDALIGGAIGLLVTAVLLPPNPVKVTQRAAEPLLTALADGFEAAAGALDTRDKAAADEALEGLRNIGAALTAYNSAVAASKEAVRLSPVWWRYRDRLARYADIAPDLESVTRNARVLARRAAALLRDEEPVPTELVASVESLGTATRKLGKALESGEEPTVARELTRSAVRHATQALESPMGFSGKMMVGQIRFAASDLLRAMGLPREEAETVVRDAARPAQLKRERGQSA
jgi:uncharacterized membrane protein YgaE (UPF0421/DUF939 family)